MVNLNFPDLANLSAVKNGGKLPKNRRQAYRAMVFPAFQISDQEHRHLKQILDDEQTDFLQAPDGRFFALCFVRNGYGVSTIADWAVEQGQAEHLQGKTKAAGNG